MMFSVLVRVNQKRLPEFAKMLGNGELDRSSIVSQTYCYLDDPAVGFSIWEARDKEEFEENFKPWKEYYDEVNVKEVVPPEVAMGLLMKRLQI